MSEKLARQPNIRHMTSDDLEQVLTWRNHPDIRRYMYTQHEIALKEHQQWFERASQDTRKHLLIFEIDGLALGFININELHSVGVADWGFYAAPDAPKGNGKKLGYSALEYAFQQLELHKVCGQALAFNERSIAFHLAMGFKQEGILRDQHFDGVDYHAVINFGLLRHEWLQNQGIEKHE